MTCFPGLVKLVGRSSLELMKLDSSLVIEVVVIIAVLLTYHTSPRRAVTHLVNKVIFLSFTVLVGDMENSMMGQTG